MNLRIHTLKEPEPLQVIRARLQLKQAAFAGWMGVSLQTVQDWEQGRRKLSGPAVDLLRIAEQKPEVFLELNQARPYVGQEIACQPRRVINPV